MRNLEILTRYSFDISRVLQKAGCPANTTVLYACFDEFTQKIAVYTSTYCLIIIKQAKTSDTTIEDQFLLDSQFQMSDENPSLEDSFLVQMDFI
jgi:hypothetical protein